MASISSGVKSGMFSTSKNSCIRDALVVVLFDRSITELERLERGDSALTLQQPLSWIGSTWLILDQLIPGDHEHLQAFREWRQERDRWDHLERARWASGHRRTLRGFHALGRIYRPALQLCRHMDEIRSSGGKEEVGSQHKKLIKMN